MENGDTILTEAKKKAVFSKKNKKNSAFRLDNFCAQYWSYQGVFQSPQVQNSTPKNFTVRGRSLLGQARDSAQASWVNYEQKPLIHDGYVKTTNPTFSVLSPMKLPILLAWPERLEFI